MQSVGQLLTQWYYLYSDTVRTAAGVAAGIISVFAGLLRLRRDRKLLCYSWQWLYSGDLHHPGDLEDNVYDKYWHLHREYPAHRIRALRIRLRNAGQQTIRRDDFDGGAPIDIYFDPTWQDSGVIEFAAAYNCMPRNLNPVVHRKDEYTISISPLLLNGGPFLHNGGDEFDVMVLLRSEKRKVDWLRRVLDILLWPLRWLVVLYYNRAAVSHTPFRMNARIAGIDWPTPDSLPALRSVLRSGIQHDLAGQFGRVVASSAIYITVRLLFVLVLPNPRAPSLKPPMALLLQVLGWTEVAALLVGLLAVCYTAAIVLDALMQAVRGGAYRWLRNLRDWLTHIRSREQRKPLV